ncbi:MAG: phytase [Acidobacteriota bacterium]
MIPLLVWGGLVLAQVDVKPLRETVSERWQTDDPAVWVNGRKPEESLIVGTVKMAAPAGAVAVYRLDGSVVMRVEGVDRPNNVDVGYGFRWGRRSVDIAVVTERNRNRLRVFEVVAGVGLKSLGEVAVFAEPMGVALYRRKRDGAMFAIVSRKAGPSGRYLWQYRLRGETGELRAEKVREFGLFSGGKEIEAVVVDEELGYVYYSAEGAGIRKYHADPEAPGAERELALFGQQGWGGDREGLAIYAKPGGKGYLIATDQRAGNSVYHVFARAGGAGGAHDHGRELGSFRVGAAATDGIEASSRGLGAGLPKGLFVAMNDSRRNFILVDWREIERGLGRLIDSEER